FFYFKSQNLAANIKHQTSILSKKDQTCNLELAPRPVLASEQETVMHYEFMQDYNALQVVNCHAFIN
ncbi:hypothetical protein ACJX0J_017400, partial [Zea mays]